MSSDERLRAWPQTFRSGISNPVHSGGQCHLIHLTILIWRNMHTKVTQDPISLFLVIALYICMYIKASLYVIMLVGLSIKLTKWPSERTIYMHYKNGTCMHVWMYVMVRQSILPLMDQLYILPKHCPWPRGWPVFFIELMGQGTGDMSMAT